MRNIYDIIEEQKAIVDVNIASYDLIYVTEHFINHQENYYLQEGVGEGIKKAANMVADIIKKIIKGIRELINKVVGFFTGRKNDVEKLEQKIQDANNGKVTKPEEQEEKPKDKVEQKKEEIRQRVEKKEEPKVMDAETKARISEKAKKRSASLLDVLKNSKQKVSVRYFAKLDKKMDLSNLFFKNVGNVANEMVSKHVFNKDILVMHIIDKTFRGRGSFDSNSGSAMEITKRIELEIGEDNHDPREYYVSVLADEIYGYLKRTDDAIKYLKGQEKSATDALNKLLKYVEGGINQLNTNEGSEKQNNAIGMIKAASGSISEFVNVMCRSITRGYTTSFQIAKKVTDDYAATMTK